MEKTEKTLKTLLRKEEWVENLEKKQMIEKIEKKM